MPSVLDHYARHLGPVYAWMAGGIDAATDRGATELNALDLPASNGRPVVDLGAGFGMHAIPLARAGYPVIAMDSCAALLDELRARKGNLPIDIVMDDLLAFSNHLQESPQAILCMGDTLTHLDSEESVRQLCSEAASALHVDGYFVISFRDYSSELAAEQRFIPVRSDENRILTCFLEYTDTHVTVHDLLHEREAAGWKLRVSSYRKLRIAPEWMIRTLESFGFIVRRESGLAGMIRLVAQHD